MNFLLRAAALLLLLLVPAGNGAEGPPATRTPPLGLILPTANDGLLRGEPAAFYQYVERNYHEETTYPWEGGQYGFVRNPVDSTMGILFTRFHEGVDIKPLRRDAREEPLDEIYAVAPGRVVHVSAEAGASNYGKYVVVEHRLGGCPYYSLSAHLSEIFVAVGQEVLRGATLARMGHTGEGIDRARSHVHFELNLMLSTGFEAFYQATAGAGDPNKHGLFNGQNLAGMDVARLYAELSKNPALTVPEFMAGEETFFKALIPAGPQPPDLLRLYPWMGPGSTPAAAAAARPAAWEISFTRAGLPLKVLPSATAVAGPTLSFVQPATVPYWQLTHRLLFGAGRLGVLSPYGRKLVELIALPPAATPQIEAIPATPPPVAPGPTPGSSRPVAKPVR